MKVTGFGRWLDKWMRQADLNQAGLAAKLGVREPTVSGWRYGRNAPNPDNIRRIADVFSVPVTDVYAALGRVPPDEDLPEDVRQIVEMLKALSEAEQRRWAAAIRAYREQQESEQHENEQSG
jgi:transcriptional regulator with XRE-family HTH domain